MSVQADFFTSEFLFQSFDTEVVWTWALTDDQSAMFYDVIPSAVPAMKFARVTVTQIVQCGVENGTQRTVELHVKLDFDGPEDQRPPFNQGLLNFHAIRVPAR